MKLSCVCVCALALWDSAKIALSIIYMCVMDVCVHFIFQFACILDHRRSVHPPHSFSLSPTIEDHGQTTAALSIVCILQIEKYNLARLHTYKRAHAHAIFPEFHCIHMRLIIFSFRPLFFQCNQQQQQQQK